MSVIALLSLDLGKFVTTYKFKERHNSLFIGASLESADIVVAENDNVAELHGEIIQHEKNKLSIRCIADKFMVQVNGESIRCKTNLNHEDVFTIGPNKFTIRYSGQLKDDNGRFDLEYRMVLERLDKIKHKVIAIYNKQHITKRSILFGKEEMLGKIAGKEFFFGHNCTSCFQQIDLLVSKYRGLSVPSTGLDSRYIKLRILKDNRDFFQRVKDIMI